jgi:hypothetical protein
MGFAIIPSIIVLMPEKASNVGLIGNAKNKIFRRYQ